MAYEPPPREKSGYGLDVYNQLSSNPEVDLYYLPYVIIMIYIPFNAVIKVNPTGAQQLGLLMCK